jgi:hypothetical protein
MSKDKMSNNKMSKYKMSSNKMLLKLSLNLGTDNLNIVGN